MWNLKIRVIFVSFQFFPQPFVFHEIYTEFFSSFVTDFRSEEVTLYWKSTQGSSSTKKSDSLAWTIWGTQNLPKTIIKDSSILKKLHLTHDFFFGVQSFLVQKSLRSQKDMENGLLAPGWIVKSNPFFYWLAN